VVTLQIASEAPDMLAAVEYPALPPGDDSSQGSENEEDDDARSETSTVLPTIELPMPFETPASAEDQDLSDEEFTEASLQLDIQREYIESQQEEDNDEIDSHEAQKHESVSNENDLHGNSQLDTDTDTYMEDSIVVTKETSELREEPLDMADHQPSASSNEEDETMQPQSPAQPLLPDASKNPFDDITNGLTLSFTPAKASSAVATPRKLHSPPPPPRIESGADDVTMTVAIDDDTAILKDFLNRAAASKAEKAATHRRESLQNRRDSDVIRNALASPRRVLEDKDPNSPSKYTSELALDLPQTLTLSLPSDNVVLSTSDPMEEVDISGTRPSLGSRRSSRVDLLLLLDLVVEEESDMPNSSGVASDSASATVSGFSW
jgi:hypothetical protein